MRSRNELMNRVRVTVFLVMVGLIGMVLLVGPPGALIMGAFTLPGLLWIQSRVYRLPDSLDAALEELEGVIAAGRQPAVFRLLRECEWAPVHDQIYYCPSCPICGGLEQIGHDDDCELARVLYAGEGDEGGRRHE